MKRRFIILLTGAVTLVVGLGAGTAFAVWNTSGTGSATASTGAPAALTVQAVASGSPLSDLIPGGSADLLVQVNNPNTYTVTITGISENGTTVTPVGGTGCTSANSGVSVPAQTGLTIAVASGTQVLHFPNGAAMTTASASGCQGASFQIPVTVTVQR